jgi:hypothetical protein
MVRTSTGFSTFGEGIFELGENESMFELYQASSTTMQGLT